MDVCVGAFGVSVVVVVVVRVKRWGRERAGKTKRGCLQARGAGNTSLPGLAAPQPAPDWT